MPRMRVDLRPSTIQFDDGEDPVIGGIARFGTTMANLPVQIGRIKMEQAQTDERHNEFQAEQQLRMNADKRAGNESRLRMATEHGANIKHGYETPDIPDGPAVSPDQIREQELAQYGRQDRAAELDLKKYRAADPHANGQWMPIPADKMGDPRKLYNTKTHEMVDVDPPEGAPATPAAKPPSTNWWTAPGAPSAFNRHIPQRPPAQGGGLPQMGQSDAGAAPAPAAAVSYDEAKRQYDQGNHLPLADLLRHDPTARERAAQDAAVQRAKTQKPNFAPPNTYEGGPPGMPSMSDMFGRVPDWMRSVPDWMRSAGDYIGQHTTPGAR